MEKLTKSIIIVLLGSFIMSIGIVCFLNAGFGVDPLATFTVGIKNTMSLTYGQATYIIMGILIMILLIFDRINLGIGTVLNTAVIGYSVDRLIAIFNIGSFGFAISILLLIIGVILIGFGIGLYILGGLGAGAIDALMLSLASKTNVSVKLVRIIMDMILLSLGGILGAKLGVGTVMGMFMLGPIIELTLSICGPRVTIFLKSDSDSL